MSFQCSKMKLIKNISFLLLFLFGLLQILKKRTTTIGKLAYRLRTEGNQTVLLAACDTFRAGAVEQLQQWADRAEVDMYGPSENTKSPAAVLYGALDKAIADKYDTVLVDTSGRLSNNEALTAELVKMKKVIQKRLSVEQDGDGNSIPNMDVPHESVLVLDAAQGRMALDSARVWNKEVGLSGLILTKLDGSARGGSVVAISRDLDLPVKLIGVGEGIEDLRDVSKVWSIATRIYLVFWWVDGWMEKTERIFLIVFFSFDLFVSSWLQFEPERFVDGLLGIGQAGGKGSASEGAKLASRLETLRNERAARTPEIKKKEPVSAGGGPSPSYATPPPGNPSKGGKRKNKRKKGKK